MGMFGHLKLSPSLIVVAALLCGSMAVAKEAAAPNPYKLLKKSDKKHRIEREHIKVEMLLQEKGGEKRARVTESYVFQDPKDRGDKLWIRFDAPGDVKGTTLLTLEKRDADDDQWLYLPAFKKTRRLGASDLGDRFAGTDLFYEDLKRRRVEDYSYDMKGSDKISGEDCWVIEARPKAEDIVKSSPYRKSLLWLHKNHLYIMKLQHFDRNEKPLKQIIAHKVKKVTDEAWRPDAIEVIDVQRNHRTLMRTTAREVNEKIPESVFRPESFQQ